MQDKRSSACADHFRASTGAELGAGAHVLVCDQLPAPVDDPGRRAAVRGCHGGERQGYLPHPVHAGDGNTVRIDDRRDDRRGTDTGRGIRVVDVDGSGV